ncbi:hypothetical protein PhCBS80983_g00958 [Powellomyces hirtus]|uniref:MYND-type domain-containing protein n=1 Tax=Powellomyces hirtus TaxID=109895 RepID=A0A507EEU5_9FUNG|nr:hypothetical protein PhCBS80983_g00958 [Powellomyces hirtus]
MGNHSSVSKKESLELGGNCPPHAPVTATPSPLVGPVVNHMGEPKSLNVKSNPAAPSPAAYFKKPFAPPPEIPLYSTSPASNVVAAPAAEQKQEYKSRLPEALKSGNGEAIAKCMIEDVNASRNFPPTPFKYQPPPDAPNDKPLGPAPWTAWSSSYLKPLMPGHNMPGPADPKGRSRSPTVEASFRPKPGPPTAIENRVVKAVEFEESSCSRLYTPVNVAFRKLMEQARYSAQHTDPTYGSFPCRYMHTANTMGGSHYVSRYAIDDALFGMEPSKLIRETWTTVSPTETFTLGNGVVLIGGTEYKRIIGALGIAVQVRGIVIAGISPCTEGKTPPPTPKKQKEQDCFAGFPSLCAAAADKTGNAAAAGTHRHLASVNVLPCTGTTPVTVHYYAPGTRVGYHLVLDNGATLDSDMVIHGPFTYRGIRFGENTLIHADGVLAKFHVRKEPAESAPEAPAPNAPDQRAEILFQHLEAIKAAQARQDKVQGHDYGPPPKVAAAPAANPPQQQTTATKTKKIYVEICIDRMLSPEVFPENQNLRAKPPTVQPTNLREASTAVMAFSVCPPNAAALRLSKLPTTDCYGFHHTILPFDSTRVLRRPRALCHINTLEADRIAGAEDERRCAYCAITRPRNTMPLCAQCRCVRYCSRSCQISHWKTDHKRWCYKTAVKDSTDRIFTDAPVLAGPLANFLSPPPPPARGSTSKSTVPEKTHPTSVQPEKIHPTFVKDSNLLSRLSKSTDVEQQPSATPATASVPTPQSTKPAFTTISKVPTKPAGHTNIGLVRTPLFTPQPPMQQQQQQQQGEGEHQQHQSVTFPRPVQVGTWTNSAAFSTQAVPAVKAAVAAASNDTAPPALVKHFRSNLAPPPGQYHLRGIHTAPTITTSNTTATGASDSRQSCRPKGLGLAKLGCGFSTLFSSSKRPTIDRTSFIFTGSNQTTQNADGAPAKTSSAPQSSAPRGDDDPSLIPPPPRPALPQNPALKKPASATKRTVRGKHPVKTRR